VCPDRIGRSGIARSARLPELGPQRASLLEARGNRATGQPFDLRMRVLHGSFGGGHVHVEPDRDPQNLRRRPDPHGIDERSVGLSLEEGQCQMGRREGIVQQLDRSGGAVRAPI
jgi:hypothetical protein